MVLSLVIGLTVLAGCTSSTSGARAGGRVRVVAAFFPLAEAARAAGGDHVDVRDLTPTGSEPHDLEVTPDQVDAISAAGLVVVMGDGFQPAVEDLARRRGDHALFVLDALGLSKQQAKDPHVGLDPVTMAKLFALVRDRLGTAVDATSADAFAEQLRTLDTEFASGLAHCDRREI